MKKDWWFYRPIVEKVISYSEALEMSQHQLYEINAAIDRLIEMKNAARN